MQNEFLEGFEKLNKSALDSVKRIGEINTRAFERLTERQLEVATACLNGGVKQFQAFTEVKDANDVKDVIANQTKLMAELNETLVEQAKQAAEIMMETRTELTGLFEEGMKAASAAPAAKAVRKAA